jgi:hypothetical protein
MAGRRRPVRSFSSDRAIVAAVAAAVSVASSVCRAAVTLTKTSNTNWTISNRSGDERWAGSVSVIDYVPAPGLLCIIAAAPALLTRRRRAHAATPSDSTGTARRFPPGPAAFSPGPLLQRRAARGVRSCPH